MLRAIVVGRSAGALDEYAAACQLCNFDVKIVVGKTGEVFPDRIDHWVSFHADLFPTWMERREKNGFPPPGKFWAAIYNGRKLYNGAPLPAPIDFVRTLGGSSGFMAVQVALDELGVDRTILAGVPMTADAGHLAQASGAHEIGQPWKEANNYWATWEEHMPRLLGRLKSMSGRTCDFLGAPDREWLEGGTEG